MHLRLRSVGRPFELSLLPLGILIAGCAAYSVHGPQFDRSKPPTISMKASPAYIVSGSSSILKLTAHNATGLTIAGSDGSTYRLSGNGGQQVVSPAATTTYIATATGAAGSATARITIGVAMPPPTVSIRASPRSIIAGGSSRLSIAVTDTSSLIVTGSDGSSYTLNANGGTLLVSPKNTTTYVATAQGIGGKASSSTIITVTPTPEVTLSANPASIAAGGSSTLTVSAENATVVTLTGSDGSNYTLPPEGGTELVDPTSTTTYAATAKNGAFSATATALINVNAAGPSAYVYVRTSQLTILAFSAAADGTLTQVQNLPMAGDELLAANSKSVFIANSNTGRLHTYSIQPGGSLRGPVGSVNTQDYGGAQCGMPSGEAVIDRSGQYLSVELRSMQGIYDTEPCATWQTYDVQPDGGYTFEGYDYSDPWSDPGVRGQGGDTLALNISAVSGNNLFAYGVVGGNGKAWLSMMQRDQTGALHLVQNLGEVDPQPDAAGDSYMPEYVAADGSNHLAVGLSVNTKDPAQQGKHWLASYTIDNSTGAIRSTSTFANLAEVDLEAPWPIAISPAGDLVAVGSTNGDGFQVFHFNGANPPTSDSPVIPPVTSSNIVQIAWDNDHHLYVLGQEFVNPWQEAQGFLYVYTVTNAGVTMAPGSPWTLPNSFSLFVVPKT